MVNISIFLTCLIVWPGDYFWFFDMPGGYFKFFDLFVRLSARTIFLIFFTSPVNISDFLSKVNIPISFTCPVVLPGDYFWFFYRPGGYFKFFVLSGCLTRWLFLNSLTCPGDISYFFYKSGEYFWFLELQGVYSFFFYLSGGFSRWLFLIFFTGLVDISIFFTCPVFFPGDYFSLFDMLGG